MSDANQGNAEPPLAENLLRGAAEIAEFLYGDRKYRRRIFYLASKTKFPCFRIGSQICALKSVLRAHFH